jgi:hypothetical protein
MPRTDRWPERIGAVFLPVADTVEVAEDAAPPGEGPPPLPQGCYTLSLRWAGTPQNAPGFVGTLRIEPTFPGVRFSADLYRDRPTAALLADPSGALGELQSPAAEAADTGGVIPIYPRANYHSYLRGVGAKPSSTPPGGAGDTVVLEFEEFEYVDDPEDFNGRFKPTPTGRLQFALAPTGSPGLYSGTAHADPSQRGTVSIRWISPHYRHAHLQLHTLEGAVPPPAEVEGVTFATIFADAGWELSVTDGGTFPLPAELSDLNITDCTQTEKMKMLVTLAPGFDPTELDSVWRTHLLAIPADLGCSRGWAPGLFISPGSVLSRLGALIFSHDGYPTAPVGTGILADSGGPHYDRVAGQRQHQVPRAYLRSAAHEVGHAFNQIHQQDDKGEPDNSIMTTTPRVAEVLGTAGTFPDQLHLGFNDRVKTHLRHLPDPAVRPGAMGLFSAESISNVPQASVVWLELLELSVAPSSDRVTLGEPVTLSWTLTNQGQTVVSAPAELAVESLVARVSVTDPTGRVTFMRPAEVQSCPRVSLVPLEPVGSVSGSTTLFWGWDGFAFQLPGRHVVEVIVLWEVGGVPVAVSGEHEVFVFYPTSNEENEVAALLLDPDVGKAVAFGDLTPFEHAAQRIRRAEEIAPTHSANQALRRLGLDQGTR